MNLLLSRCILIISIGVMLASCSPIVDTRGYSAEAIDTSQIITGQTSAEDIASLLGTPTTVSNFGETIWYYVTQRQERTGIFATEVTQQDITAITFDADKRVSAINAFTKEQGKPVQIVGKVTPTEGHSISFVEQLLGNMGRFNAPGRGLSERNKGR
jgi:outer membrane protein assembly factor BamE (lipoprotein component of BamABCDE complex)